MSKIAQDRLTNNVIGEDISLMDTFAGTISYLRLSLTDKCNLRCLYCTPKEDVYKQNHQDLLSYEELMRITSLAVELGIGKVRLTGGEPLLRRGVDCFIENLASIPGLHDIRLTTNGVLLAEHARPLYEAGIKKINVSLDTLSKKKFQRITGADHFNRVWQGLEKIMALDFFKIKLNVVALRGINDDEILDFARLALDRNLQVRFIEYMPMGRTSAQHRDSYISSAEIRGIIRKGAGELEALTPEIMEGPASVYRLMAGRKNGQDREGRIGFISPISHRFCDSCNRLRLTARGRLRSCLLSDRETDLKSVVRQGAGDKVIKDVLLQTIRDKPRGHNLLFGREVNCHGEMSHIGG